MSVEDRISYCARLIYKTHSHLSRQGTTLSREARNRSQQVLQQAREELHHLLKSGLSL